MAAQKSNRLFGNIHPAIIVVWAAILAASALLPAIPLLGVGGVMAISNSLIWQASCSGPWRARWPRPSAALSAS